MAALRFPRMSRYRVALVHMGAACDVAPDPRLVPVIDALRAAGLDVVAVGSGDAHSEDTRKRLRGCDGTLVWVDPLGDAGDRTALDATLRASATDSVWVSAHPDVVDTIGTKEVLVSTRTLGWGSDCHLYQDAEEFCRLFPTRLATHGIRVLKASRGNGGRTVWKVRVQREDQDTATRRPLGPEDPVLVQHAAVRDGTETSMALSQLMSQCARVYESWNGTGRLVDQEFVPSIVSGMLRCYLVGEKVIGFARQYASGTEATGPLEVRVEQSLDRGTVFGLPSAKVMYGAEEPAFAGVRHLLETDWVPGMQRLLDVATRDLPMLWDVDLVVGPTRTDGEQRFVLCEINASCVTPFPPAVPAAIARRVLERQASLGGS